MTASVVAFVTDFGTRDPFVGVMKAVVLARCPGASLVDLSHEIAPQSVAEGAFWLAKTHRFFPAGTVFVAIVDPGVGTARRGVVARAHGRLFVGPDNGLFTSIVDSDARADAFEIDLGRCGLPAPSRTFHGRDVFAPIAGELAAGRLVPTAVGSPAAVLCPTALPACERAGAVLTGVVATVDHFGNLITNLEVGELPGPASGTRIELGSLSLPLSETYSDVAHGELVAVVDAWGVVEIAVREGNAASRLGLGRGTRVTAVLF